MTHDDKVPANLSDQKNFIGGSSIVTYSPAQHPVGRGKQWLAYVAKRYAIAPALRTGPSDHKRRLISTTAIPPPIQIGSGPFYGRYLDSVHE